MIDVRSFESLGAADHGWLNAKHHFSFANYVDPKRSGWGKLLVWNDDQIKAGTGFDRHGHRDMEIITYVREGAITHRDHLNNEGRTVAGDVQVMSAGRGILHEEWNLEDTDTRIFQIWIQPDRAGVTPRWETARFPRDTRKNQLVPLASGRKDATAETLWIAQDAAVLGATLDAGTTLTHDLTGGRLAYLVPARGTVTVNGVEVSERSGAAIRDVDSLEIMASQDAEIILVDLPPEQ